MVNMINEYLQKKETPNWTRIAERLNNMGPASKSDTKWMKCYCEMKSKAKKRHENAAEVSAEDRSLVLIGNNVSIIENLK